MKVLVFGDIHLSSRGQAWGRPNYVWEAMTFLSDNIKNYNPDLIINVGDLLDKPLVSDSITLMHFNRLMSILSTRKVCHILGSHDVFSVDNKIGGLFFVPYTKHSLVERTFIDGNIGYASYLVTDIESFINSNKDKMKVLFCHHDLGDLYVKYPEIMFISGHIHLASDNNNCHYVGSLIMNPGDYFEDSKFIFPGIVMLDTDVLKIERVPFNKSLLQFKVVINKREDIFSISGILFKIKENDVRIRIVNKIPGLDKSYINGFISDIKNRLLKENKSQNIYYTIVDDFEDADFESFKKAAEMKAIVTGVKGDEGPVYDPKVELESVIKEDFSEYLEVFYSVLRFSKAKNQKF